MADRILLFTGKGGVGKTTCAAATALRAADAGKKTLIISTDPAHSLADALDVALGPEPVAVTDRLFAQEVDLFYSMKKHWRSLRKMMLAVMRWQGVDDVAAEEMAALPGMEEASALLWLHEFQTAGEYDTIIIDSAPTGETLTLLTLPQVTRWWLGKALPFQKQAIKGFGLAVRKTTGIPLDLGYEEMDSIFEKLTAVQSVLADPEISSVRIVLNPERMVIQEAKRAYTYLQLYGYTVDAAIVNRIMDPETAGPAWSEYLHRQESYMVEIENSFSAVPIWRVPHFQREVFGFERLREVAEFMYGESDPLQVFPSAPAYRLDRHEDTYILGVDLPFISEENVEVYHRGDELVISVANQRRNYLLPRFLTYYSLASTTFGDGALQLIFEPSGNHQ